MAFDFPRLGTQQQEQNCNAASKSMDGVMFDKQSVES
jgi:hypothetical protein